jgi:hypothetical protein
MERIYASNEREVQASKFSRENTGSSVASEKRTDETSEESERRIDGAEIPIDGGQFDFRALLAEGDISNNGSISAARSVDGKSAIVPMMEYKPEIEVVLPSVSVLRIPSVFQTLGARGANESPTRAGNPARKNSGNTPHKRFFARAAMEIGEAESGGGSESGGPSLSSRVLPSAPRGRRVTNYFILRSSQMHYPAHAVPENVDSSEGSEVEREREREWEKEKENSPKKSSLASVKEKEKELSALLETEEKVRLEMSQILSDTSEAMNVDGLKEEEQRAATAAESNGQLLTDSATKIIPLLERETTISAILAGDDAAAIAGEPATNDNGKDSTTTATNENNVSSNSLISVEFQGSVEDAAKAAMKKLQLEEESTTVASSTATPSAARASGLLSNSGHTGGGGGSHLSSSGKEGGWSGGWEKTNKETTERKYRDCLASKRNHYLTLPVVITASIFAGAFYIYMF